MLAWRKPDTVRQREERGGRKRGEQRTISLAPSLSSITIEAIPVGKQKLLLLLADL
jgi:hypothetical protein